MNLKFSFFRDVALFLQSIIGSSNLLNSIENKLISKGYEYAHQSIFIVGGPRTGTTLLSQLLINYFDLSYFTNLQSFFYKSPAVISLLSKPFMNVLSSEIELKSTYGYVNGLFAPSEAGEICRYWFGKNDLETVQDYHHKEHVRSSVGFLSYLSKKPLLIKNLNNSLRIQNIRRLLPESFFIWVKRQPLYSAQSLLTMRKDLYNDYSKWASVKPMNYSYIKTLPYCEQVVRQIKDIDEYIQIQMDQIDPVKIHTIDYNKLCDDWTSEMDLIADAYKKATNNNLIRKKPIQINLKLVRSETQHLPDNDWASLQKAVTSIYGKS